jgi:hypothetical protein
MDDELKKFVYEKYFQLQKKYLTYIEYLEKDPFLQEQNKSSSQFILGINKVTQMLHEN